MYAFEHCPRVVVVLNPPRLQLRMNSTSSEVMLTGTHDVDAVWMQRVRSAAVAANTVRLCAVHDHWTPRALRTHARPA
ncbi:hypothetical protein EON66_07290 [archaeon]|nr:MAG: hypothetical protein EON66_07290 [archaeon]